jgi:putative flippase GtrA
MQALLFRFLPPARVALVMQFLRFGVVGGFGFVVTAAVVYATRPFIGNYWAIVPAFLVAATGNWVLNRLWTFRGHGTRGQSLYREWSMFVAANLMGFALNAGVYWTLVAVSPLCAAIPLIPLLAGTLVGMFANFFLSRRVVFR